MSIVVKRWRVFECYFLLGHVRRWISSSTF